MLPKDLTKDIKIRLKNIRGQVDHIIRMIDEENDPEKILFQFKAAQGALDKAHFLLIDETYRKALALQISETADACPGNCGNEKKIEALRQEFPYLKADNLTLKMKEITQLKERLEHYNRENNAT